ncbi:metal-dependent hydrolase [Candidatus Woesearchaeota archaeon]|nr:metal-dependent hydrolase [Candidatus Woesearchaeota archaeon]
MTYIFLFYWIFVVVLGALIPDIDSKSSMISRLLLPFAGVFIILVFIGIISFFQGFILCSFLLILKIYSVLFSRQGKFHRRSPHSVIFGFFVGLGIFFLFESWILFASFFISFLAHIILDRFF